MKAWIVGNPRLPETVSRCGDTFTFKPLAGAEEEASAVAELIRAEGRAEAEVFIGSQAPPVRPVTCARARSSGDILPVARRPGWRSIRSGPRHVWNLTFADLIDLLTLLADWGPCQ